MELSVAGFGFQGSGGKIVIAKAIQVLFVGMLKYNMLIYIYIFIFLLI